MNGYTVYDSKGKQHSHFDLVPDGKGWFKEGKGSAGLFMDGRLPKSGETWFLCEGVKDAAALRSLGFNAIGLPTREMAVKYARLLRGCRVIIVPDRDVDGEAGAQKTAARLYGVATSVHIATLPSEIKTKGGADVRDILAKPNGEELLRQEIEDAVEWEPAAKTTTENVHNCEQTKSRALTDMGNAERLVARHGEDFHYCYAWVKPLIWNGQCWPIDNSGEAERRAKDTVRAIHGEAANEPDSSRRGQIAKHAIASQKAERLNAMFKPARSEPGVAISPDELDQNSWLLNLLNGTLDLRTQKLRPHDRKDLITKIAPVKFDIDADCPTWISFIKTITAGDKDLADFLRRATGMSLSGFVAEHVLMFLFGPGATGKSTFLNTLQALLGEDYSMKAPPDLLMVKRSSHPTERADLFGKRFVVCIESEDGHRLAESLVKELTGGDRVRVRRMREDFWEFDPTHKIWLASNHKPVIKGTDLGIWRRIKLVPFTVIIPPNQQDTKLPSKLLEELPGILNWALLGCMEWQAEGLGEAKAVTVATDNYRNEMDVLGAFIQDCCLLSQSHSIGATILYKNYKNWCDDNGERPLNQTRFGTRLGERGITKRRASQGIMRDGISLR